MVVYNANHKHQTDSVKTVCKNGIEVLINDGKWTCIIESSDFTKKKVLLSYHLARKGSTICTDVDNIFLISSRYHSKSVTAMLTMLKSSQKKRETDKKLPAKIS